MTAAGLSASASSQKATKFASAPPIVTTTERSVAPGCSEAINARSSSVPLDWLYPSRTDDRSAAGPPRASSSPTVSGCTPLSERL